MTRLILRVGAGVLVGALLSGAQVVARGGSGIPAAAATPVNLNTATEKQLEDLPGVGPATAKKIIAGRPYASVADLAKAGVSKATIEKIAPLVTVGTAAASTSAAAATGAAASTSAHAAPKGGAMSNAPAGPVDLNTATEKQLVDLPGIGPATAKKIIAGRPYASTADLAKAGVSQSTIAKLGSLVMVSGAAAPSAARTLPRPPPPAPPAAPIQKASTPTGQPSGTTSAAASTVASIPPSPGMVWVNLDTKVYHKAGDRYYGKTKHGQWMTEQQALAGGYRASKSEMKKAGTE